MVFGIDYVSKMIGRNKKTILAVVGTMDRNFSKYWSNASSIPDGTPLTQVLPNIILEGLN